MRTGEGGGVAGFDARNTAVIALAHDLEFIPIRLGDKIIAVAAPHVGHVDSQHPEEPLALARS